MLLEILKNIFMKIIQNLSFCHKQEKDPKYDWEKKTNFLFNLILNNLFECSFKFSKKQNKNFNKIYFFENERLKRNLKCESDLGKSFLN